jgi:hypothetical protein
VLFLVDSKLETGCPIIAHTEGRGVLTYDMSGRLHPNGLEKDEDLQTIPEQLPNVVTFVTQYLHAFCCSHPTFYLAYSNKMDCCVVITKLTYNQNTNETSTETVWTKESGE